MTLILYKIRAVMTTVTSDATTC